MIGDLKRCLLERRAEWGLPQSDDWRPLFFNNYHPHCSDLDFFWFCGRETRPRAVVKLSRDAERTRREFEGLSRAYASGAARSPRPLHFGPFQEFWMVWMEGAPGTRFTGKHTGPILRSMVETVADLHLALREPTPSASGDRFERAVVEPLRVVGGFGPSTGVREACDRLVETVRAHGVAFLPVIPQHGDLYDGNLLGDGRVWRAIDWESFNLIDLPAYDLYTLLISALLEDAPASDQWRPDLAAEIPALVDFYRAKLGLAPEEMSLLLPLALANWFSIQWRDGRAAFLNRMYPTVVDYFEHRDRWESVFFGSGGR